MGSARCPLCAAFIGRASGRRSRLRRLVGRREIRTRRVGPALAPLFVARPAPPPAPAATRRDTDPEASPREQSPDRRAPYAARIVSCPRAPLRRNPFIPPNPERDPIESERDKAGGETDRGFTWTVVDDATWVTDTTGNLVAYLSADGTGWGMSRRLLKFSGGSVDDYAICRSS